MKKKSVHILFVFVACAITSCVRNEKITPKNQMIDNKNIIDTLQSGVFVTKDAGHPTSGKLYLIKLADSSFVLQFENFSTGEGPDVDILVSRSETYMASQVIKIDDLKNSGTFVVNIPKSINYTEYNVIMIWCEQFDVLFGISKLE